MDFFFDWPLDKEKTSFKLPEIMNIRKHEVKICTVVFEVSFFVGNPVCGIENSAVHLKYKVPDWQEQAVQNGAVHQMSHLVLARLLVPGDIFLG